MHLQWTAAVERHRRRSTVVVHDNINRTRADVAAK